MTIGCVAGYRAIDFESAPDAEIVSLGAIEKQAWGSGPWLNEPDWQRWQHAGLECMIHRTGVTGALCGYVAVRRGHPFWGVHYNNIPVDVHGGLTFGEQLGPRYWIGFDCAHYLDVSPAMDARLKQIRIEFGRGGVYRDLAYVRAETERLAEQVAAAGAS